MELLKVKKFANNYLIMDAESVYLLPKKLIYFIYITNTIYILFIIIYNNMETKFINLDGAIYKMR